MAEERRVGGDEAGQNLRGTIRGDPEEQSRSVVDDDGAGTEREGEAIRQERWRLCSLAPVSGGLLENNEGVCLCKYSDRDR
jgi:hypothetical protein